MTIVGKEDFAMKSIKLILTGIAVLLFGVCSILLAGLDLPTYHNGIYELLGVVCPVVGVALAVFGFLRGD